MLIVWYDTRRVGVLRQHDRQLAFQYDQTWVEAQDSFPLSPRIPLADGESIGDEPLFFFSNLLPEGPLLKALCKLKRLPEGDTFAQLQEFGADAAGAFSLLKEGERPSVESWRYKPYKDEELEKDLEKMRKGLAPLYAQHGELRLSLAGAQDKLPVHFENDRLYLPLNGAPSTHILKPPLQPQSEFPHSVENEALCVALAQETLSERGDRVAEDVCILHRGKDKLLLVRRFDRVQENNRWKRLHQLDFCQLAGVLPDQKYEKNGGPGFKVIFDLIEKWSALPAVDRLHALDWTLFNFLVGNADAHAKNLAVVPAGGGLYLLAPFYDILATGVYPHITDRMAMKIGGEDRPNWIREKNWMQFAEEVRVNGTLLKNRAEKIADRAIARLGAVSDQLGISTRSAVVNHLKKTITGRARVGARANRS